MLPKVGLLVEMDFILFFVFYRSSLYFWGFIVIVKHTINVVKLDSVFNNKQQTNKNLLIRNTKFIEVQGENDTL